MIIKLLKKDTRVSNIHVHVKLHYHIYHVHVIYNEHFRLFLDKVLNVILIALFDLILIYLDVIQSLDCKFFKGGTFLTQPEISWQNLCIQENNRRL